MNIKVIVLLMAIGAVSSCSEKQEKRTDTESLLTKQLDSLFNFCYSNGMFNGAVSVSKNDTVIYKKAFGYANNATKEKVTPASVFYIASVSKQFTAMGIQILAESGKLSYDDRINDFITEFPAFGKNITIRQLLNHTSGITDTEYYKLINPSNEDVLKTLIKQDTPELETGKTWRYSNSGYVLLALIIERVSDQSIDEFFKRKIFEPLQMDNTTTNRIKADQLPKLVQGYSIIGSKSNYASSVIGPGGIYATINDLEKWNKALNTNKLVTRKTLDIAFKNGQVGDSAIAIHLPDQTYGYGFGWLSHQKGSQNYVSHDGSVEGFRSLIKKNLSNGYDYIFLTNQGGRLAFNALTASLDQLLEKSQYSRPKIPITNVILKELELNDTTNLADHIKISVARKPEAYSINENAINRLAYTFLRNDKITVAIAIFKLNVALHPNSANAYDSLGEGYFLNEQYDLSLKKYQKALELDPASGNAEKMITTILQLLKDD